MHCLAKLVSLYKLDRDSLSLLYSDKNKVNHLSRSTFTFACVVNYHRCLKLYNYPLTEGPKHLEVLAGSDFKYLCNYKLDRSAHIIMGESLRTISMQTNVLLGKGIFIYRMTWHTLIFYDFFCQIVMLKEI